jgi:peptidoglycan hydrolase-like protein with peptidoglycan-binding domain
LSYPRPRHIIRASAIALACGLAAPGASALAASTGGAGLSGAAATAATSDAGHHYRGGSRNLGDRILRQGAQGHDVSVLQSDLTKAGFRTPSTGYFGSTTRSQVIRFERSRHLRANGVVTWSVAQALISAARRTAATPTAAPQAPAPATGKAVIVDGLAVAPADAPSAIKAVIAAGNKIAFKPYIYGGGHGSWSDRGYDCSGSVSYALHGGGLISSPEDSGDLESYGSRGRGRWISIWANSGHVYMYLAGLRFDTSAQSGNHGDRWTTQGRSNSGFVERHPTGY